MGKRWFIRSIFILPILLCVVGWGWSVNHAGGIAYQGSENYFGCITYAGKFSVCYEPDLRQNFGWNWWAWRQTPDWGESDLSSNDNPEIANDNVKIAFAGFRFEKGIFGSEATEQYLGSIPFWFLILIFSISLYFVWRKTKPKIGAAFPVVIKQESSQIPPHGKVT
jgi:hypothetical protein